MPAVNLSNKLNPNNMHFDKRLAEQYKYMSKTEKEMLWQQDRTEQLQALQVSPLSTLQGCSNVTRSFPAPPFALHLPRFPVTKSQVHGSRLAQEEGVVLLTIILDHFIQGMTLHAKPSCRLPAHTRQE